uniref:Uncharacterized protein K02A2.6-like n=1 Tax=Saccoglossus kowalevskii TaxID=10224 RepID=A0ABM0GVL8_SACKO|nr:PREDICTED: uncharacterized protein K02A2.6-like [Saccoglossus kowalevskii]
MILKKPLHSTPKRLQRMLLRLQQYEVNLLYHPGKQMYLADTLSRAYLLDEPLDGLQTDIETVNMLDYLPIAEPRKDDIRQHTESDESLQMLSKVIQTGFPENKAQLTAQITPYFHIRDELSTQNGVIFKGERAVVPRSLRDDMLKRIHSSHIGIEGCLRRAKESLYWPNMSAEIKDYIAKCDVCQTVGTRQQKETLIPHEVPNRPWAKVGTDQFVLNGRDYLVTVDYYSNYWEIDYLPDTTAKTVISKLKAQFARHGIPDTCISDNGPQEVSEAFKKFSKDWGFEHITSSPRYPQSNGKVENAVKTVKNIMRKARLAGSNPYLAILDFRNTPTQGMNSSPVQRLMNRRTKTTLPTTAKLLKPSVVRNVGKQIKKNKAKQAYYYNKGAKDVQTLQQGDTVRIMPTAISDKEWKKAEVNKQVNIRSYEVTTEEGRILRRNRKHLRKTGEKYTPNETADIVATPANLATRIETKKQEHKIISPDVSIAEQDDKAYNSTQNIAENSVRMTRSGRVIRKPQYLTDYVENC